MNKILVKWHCDFGRPGELSGLIITTQAEIDAAIGKRAYFGEVLGKHSEVWADMDIDQFDVVSDDSVFVEVFEDRVGASFGWNPLDYIDEEEE